MTLRICLDCTKRHRRPGPRCDMCEQAHQRARNAARPQYRGSWDRLSKAARKATPWCAICGTTVDLTLDHEHRQVECRACNASHARHRKD